ncbi:MAG: hypothetical protein ACFCBU_06895 [Cyanophyceae cyanobacterium]
MVVFNSVALTAISLAMGLMIDSMALCFTTRIRGDRYSGDSPSAETPLGNAATIGSSPP